MNTIENALIRKKSSLVTEEVKEVRSQYHTNVLCATCHELSRFIDEILQSSSTHQKNATKKVEHQFLLDSCNSCNVNVKKILSKFTCFVDELHNQDIAEIMSKYLRSCLELVYIHRDVHEVAEFVWHTLHLTWTSGRRPSDILDLHLGDCFAFLEKKLPAIGQRLKTVEEFARSIESWKTTGLQEFEVSMLMAEEDIRIAKTTSTECCDRVNHTYDLLASEVTNINMNCYSCIIVGNRTRKLKKELQHIQKKRGMLQKRSEILQQNLKEIYQKFKNVEPVL